MGARLPLPKYRDLPAEIFFHREGGAPSRRVVLQIPTADKKDSSTYVVDLDRREDAVWLLDLPRGESLRRRLELEEHVLFKTKTGTTIPLPNLDAPTPQAMLVAYARMLADAHKNGDTGLLVEDETRQLQHRLRFPAAVSPFRAAILGRGAPWLMS